ncbi:hypothetical protein [Urbifossiella limnaea]|uniref:Uncharacterized protein n=1 Tax=Urbifossiella limnaea TaxID=2528023 RepID=A0A517Y0N1_9BACT|nr:hypothetical protein [Urbifossiella limnaea]QDU23314.1 hypothetical protein ETAA1_53090 [Urbifossiella limnaea]
MDVKPRRPSAESIAGISCFGVVLLWLLVVVLGYTALVYDDRPGAPPIPHAEGTLPSTAPAAPERPWYGIIAQSELDDRGKFGDMFGVVGSLLAGLSLVGVGYTIHLQRKQLAKQQQEFHLHRFEAEDDKLAAIADTYLSTENDETLYYTEVMFEIVMPHLGFATWWSEKPYYLKEVTKQILREVVWLLHRVGQRPSAIYLEAMTRHVRNVRDNKSTEDGATLGDAYWHGGGTSEDRAQKCLLCFRQTLQVYLNYSRVWLAREHERKEAGIAIAPDYLEVMGQERGQVLAQFVEKMKAHFHPGQGRVHPYHVILEYLRAAGHAVPEGQPLPS